MVNLFWYVRDVFFLVLKVLFFGYLVRVISLLGIVSIVKLYVMYFVSFGVVGYFIRVYKSYKMVSCFDKECRVSDLGWI